MKNRYLIAVIVAVASLAGCARTAPINNIDQPVIGHYSDNQMRQAIVEAGITRHWVMTPVAPGVINGRLAQRGHVANIRVDYTPSRYSIHYVSSENLLAADNEIHRNYNNWVTALNQDIQVRLSAQQLK
ncbi:lipoprotein [Duffyella gerundensis]|uniref:hypothetical protein n=1 Tax=Duffyella TaxID=3026546 RepID=UPI001654966B|nr:hypothetical protein [Duffyella gerundensis]QTO53028.1 hypothetical protein J8I88_10645 [Duffyella gerundensis]UCB31475.1 lipoprotein [Duffyella gerundensis]